MPQCECCGKKGLFLTLDSDKNCEECAQANRNFTRLIHDGFRVYDGYFFHVGDVQGGDYPAKFSVLSKKPLTKKSMQKLMPVSNGYIGVIKNTRVSECNYITFDGKDVCEFDGISHNARKAEFVHFEKNIPRYYTTSK